ncbi:MAG: M48 family metalloprotease [Actinomycetota bacterium]|nr:M48 family metalloprotease [Actinomycetota bacterium]
MTTRGSSVLLLGTCALWLTGCITDARIDELGGEEAEKVEQKMGLVEDAALVAYVDALGRKLAAASDRPEGPWRFLVIDMPEPNAFALPGGHVYVSRGLLALVNSEDELAGVIGHEIGHVTAGHSAKRVRATIATSPVSIASGLAGFATSIVSPSLGRMVANSGQMLQAGLVVAPYGRAQENEADEIGQRIASRAGYDPAGLTAFLHSLDREVELLSGEQRSASFLDTHPVTADRVAKTRERSGELPHTPGRPIAANRAALFAKFDGIVVGPDPAKGVFIDGVFQHPELNARFAIPSGWQPTGNDEAVGAVSPGNDALVYVGVAEEGKTLDAVLGALKEEEAGLVFERFRVGKLPAARTRMTDRKRFVQIDLIEHGGDVYSMVGQATGDNAASYAATFDATTQSFRPMTWLERKSLIETRLRIREARSRETPAQLGKRVGSSWSDEQVAVANGVETSTRFSAGEPVKVGIEQRYTPRGG